jgi:serine/threonine protein kinase
MISRIQNASDPTGGIDSILAEGNLRSSVISEVHQQRSHGQLLNAGALLAERPELGDRKSIVMELAYEEFCQRVEAGESVDREAFCGQFPGCENSLHRLIEVHEFLDENSHLVPTVEVDWPEPGELFQGFSILTELGRGSFGRVYLANEIALGLRLVVIKLSVDGTTEAETLAKLQHPNIVPVYSVWQDSETGLTAICMPYLGSATLLDVLDNLFGQNRKPTRSRSIFEAIRPDDDGLLPAGHAAGSVDGELYHGSYVDGALHLGAQLAEALAYSHSQGVCHSDMKPSNVLITPGGRPMLLDFNLAFDPQAMERRLGGTLLYMAPEQLCALDGASVEARQAVGERSDIFSLGVMLYELLSGRLPFGSVATNRPAQEIRACLLKRQEQGPRRLREANKDVDPALAVLIERCLAFDGDQRPQSASELAAALRRSRSTGRRIRRWTRRHFLITTGGVAGALTASFATGYRVATRKAARMFNRGGEAYQRGDYEEADRCFKEAFEAAESKELKADAYFWRGRACLKLDRSLEAATCFAESLDLCWDVRTLACYDYACARMDHYVVKDSISRSNDAIQAGFATAELYNNLGFGLERANRLDEALNAYNQSLALQPGLRPALYNRAWIQFRRARMKGQPVDDEVRIDIEKAVNSDTATAYMFFDAAIIYSRLGEDPGQYQTQIVEHLCRALQLGADPELVRRNFKSIGDDLDLKKALALNVPVVPRNVADHLVDPFPGQPFPFH